MFKSDDIINERYKVKDLCSDSGGMGTILHVDDLRNEFDFPIVMKYCNSDISELRLRFIREVRLLKRFYTNEHVITILDDDTEYEPPYFIMKYYKDGDLSLKSLDLKNDFSLQEETAYKMLDCVSQLHKDEVYHRDIKPQNFICDGENILICDFGLGVQNFSSTKFTTTHTFGGTEGYLPPEYCRGEFKNPTIEGDIFMLGKTMYTLFTNTNPMYLMSGSLPAPLFHVIEKCCSLDSSKRYHNSTELKQALKIAYDVILERSGVIGEVFQLYEQIDHKLISENIFDPEKVREFIEKLALLEKNNKVEICKSISWKFFQTLTNEAMLVFVETFLSSYSEMVKSYEYNWPFAEHIAVNMSTLFNSDYILLADKVLCLDLALDAAIKMNRFAAMDTCVSMICSIADDELAEAVSGMLLNYNEGFIRNIGLRSCKNGKIVNVIVKLKDDYDEQISRMF